MGPVLLYVSIALGLLLIVLLIGPFLISVPPLEGTLPSEQLADPDSLFITVNDLRVHYKTVGQGEPPLILLHGFAASTFSWREVMAPLSEVGTVVSFDRPAFGLTERPMPGAWKGESPYGAATQVELTVSLMDELGIERAVLVGNSAGGRVALLTALAHPERVEALVLVDAAVYVGGGPLRVLRPLLNTPQMRRIGPLIARRITKWGMRLGRAAWHDPSGLTPEVLDGYAKSLRAENWDRALWEFARAYRSFDLPERVAAIRTPSLVITGDDDRIVPTEQSVRLADELPNAELVVIPDCGHVPQEECPEAFLKATLRYLNGLR